MIMRYQLYPWTHKGLADRIRDQLGLPVDTPKRIQDGTMQRLENWIANPGKVVPAPQIDDMLVKLEEDAAKRRRGNSVDEEEESEES